MCVTSYTIFAFDLIVISIPSNRNKKAMHIDNVARNSSIIRSSQSDLQSSCTHFPHIPV